MSRTSQAFVAIGAVLGRGFDLETAATHMRTYMLDPSEANRAALAVTGVNTDDARDFLRLLPRDPEAIDLICQLAHAWALGRSSLPTLPSWQPVITRGEVDAHGIDRMTAETLIGLIVGARRSLRIFSPFLDSRGLDVLAVALSAGTRRGVDTAIGYAGNDDRDKAIEQLRRYVHDNGDTRRLRAVAIVGSRPFPHLKMISADGERAYIGSANLTWPALTSNAEVGALVDGEHVRALERWFDALLAGPSYPRTDAPVE